MRLSHLINITYIHTYVTKPLRLTQPPNLGGTGNVYQPKGGNALQLRSKGARPSPLVDKRVGAHKLRQTYFVAF